MANRQNKKGRSKGGERHIRVPFYLMNCPAWRSLRPVERAVYVEALAFYRGDNNGYIALGVRILSERLNISKDTASRALRQLEDHGFIETTYIGTFRRHEHRASEYRFTHLQCNRDHRRASHEFMQWQKSTNHGPTTGTVRSDHRDRRKKITAHGPTTGTVNHNSKGTTVRPQGHRYSTIGGKP
jgi:DNA-binding HxlR family transcriptional regulator